MKINEQTVFNRDPETCPHEQPWVFSPEPGVVVSRCRECGAERADILMPVVKMTRREIVAAFPDDAIADLDLTK